MSDKDVVRLLMAAVGQLEEVAREQDQRARKVTDGLQKMQSIRTELDAVRQAEEAKFMQAMVRLFQDQQEKTEAALRPVIGKAWRGLIAVALGFALLYVGFALLLNHQHQRLKDVQARADAAEVSAEVQQASQHVEITSCGGRPCIRLDKDTPTWKSRGREYVLVDGQPGR